MDLLSFCRIVLDSEMSCVRFLQQEIVIPNEILRHGKAGNRCQCAMLLRERKNRNNRVSVVWRCNRNCCRAEKSVRSSNSFFTYMTENNDCGSRLSLCDIMLFIYLYLYTTSTQRQLQSITQSGPHTVNNRANLIREVFSNAIVA